MVVRRSYHKVSVTMEVQSAREAYKLVQSRVVWGGVKKFAEVVIGRQGLGPRVLA